MELETPPHKDDLADTLVLVVEDSDTQALFLEQVLLRHGCRTHLAPNGLAALEYLQTERPGIIVSDVLMPQMDGFTFCREVKDNPDLNSIPVVMLTALKDPQDIINGLEAGADNIITKPFEEEILISRLSHMLTSRKLRNRQPTAETFEFVFKGNKHTLNAERMQIVDLLLSSYEAAVYNYKKLEKAVAELKHAHALLRQQTEELEELSLTDELTGLQNRRGFFSLATQQLKVVNRTKRELVAFFIDVDNMKGINDTLGHRQGDQALIDVAKLLKEVFRESDILARVGGDEFVVLAVETDECAAAHLVGRLEKETDRFNQLATRNYKLALSVGYSVYNPDVPCDIETLITRADEAMYNIKKFRQAAHCSR